MESHPLQNKSSAVTIPTRVMVACAHHMMSRENYFIMEHEHTAGSLFLLKPEYGAHSFTFQKKSLISKDMKLVPCSTKPHPRWFL